MTTVNDEGIAMATRYGRGTDGNLYQATTWYEPVDDPHGIELPDVPGRWRIAAATTLPDGATPIAETAGQLEVAAINAANTRLLAAAQRAAATALDQAVAALVGAGLPGDVAASIAGHAADGTGAADVGSGS